jgi:hypothetical protein
MAVSEQKAENRKSYLSDSLSKAALCFVMKPAVFSKSLFLVTSGAASCFQEARWTGYPKKLQAPG